MGKNKKKVTNILVAGGSGLWPEKNHYPAVLEMKKQGYDVRLVGICDPIDPNQIEKNEKRDSLNALLEQDDPIWINPIGKSSNQLYNSLSILHQKKNIDILVVSTNPVWHYFYCKWGLDNKINIICDKPIITNSNSSFETKQARSIELRYKEILQLYERNKQINPDYAFIVPRRRRALVPFVEIANGLEEIEKKTGEGIRYMNLVLNSGIHKYPYEYTKGGAHGHLDGVGTLSHSSYHYIDLIAWYLKLATGKTKKIQITLPYIMRVKEYLETQSYLGLRTLIEGHKKEFMDDVAVPNEVLKSELDFSFYLKLLDKDDKQVGLITLIVNYSSFTPREVAFDPSVTEYAHDIHGGRMGSIYIDLHQGALQQWQLIKNDEAYFGHTIDLRRYLNPRLGPKVEKKVYKHAYSKNTVTSQDLFQYFVRMVRGEKIPKSATGLLTHLDDQKLTNKIYSTMYEKIAENYESNGGRDTNHNNGLIELRDFM